MISYAEYHTWLDAEYPYDEASCGYCATSLHGCKNLRHKQMRQESLKLQDLMDSGTDQQFRAAVLKFRKKYARFYKKVKQ
jgi:hypothetical protein